MIAGAPETASIGPMIDSTRFAVDDINANGGVLGRPLQLIELDAQSNNQLYTEYASKLMLENEVPVLIGGITSASREAVRPVVNRYQALYFYNEQYEGGVCDKFVFCTGVTPAQQLGVLVPWAVENHGRSFYTLAAGTHLRRLGQSVSGQGRRNRARPGVHPARRDRLQLGDSTHRAKPPGRGDVLAGGRQHHIAFYRQFAAAGLNTRMQIVSPTFGLGNEQVVLSPEEAEGIVVIYPYFQELDNPPNRAWVQAWHDRYGADYTYITDSACTVWNGWHLWAMAANKAGSLERAAVTETLESGLTFDSPEGQIKLDPQSHHVVHTVHLARINDQRGFEIMETFENLEPSDTKEVCDLIANPRPAHAVHAQVLEHFYFR